MLYNIFEIIHDDFTYHYKKITCIEAPNEKELHRYLDKHYGDVEICYEKLGWRTVEPHGRMRQEAYEPMSPESIFPQTSNSWVISSRPILSRCSS